MESWTLEHSVTRIWAHPPEQCFPAPCCLHNRTDHPLRSWRQNWRDDRGIMERVCPCHGVGHPDPDDLAYASDAVKIMAGYYEDPIRLLHGCPGCCRG